MVTRSIGEATQEPAPPLDVPSDPGFDEGKKCSGNGRHTRRKQHAFRIFEMPQKLFNNVINLLDLSVIKTLLIHPSLRLLVHRDSICPSTVSQSGRLFVGWLCWLLAMPIRRGGEVRWWKAPLGLAAAVQTLKGRVARELLADRLVAD